MSYRYIIIEKNQLIIRLHEHGKSRIYIFFIIECIILKLNMKYQLTIINTDYFLFCLKKNIRKVCKHLLKYSGMYYEYIYFLNIYLTIKYSKNFFYTII